MDIYLSKSFLLYVLVYSEIILSKKLSIPDISPLNPKVNECERCKVLTDSISHWLDKTSRGKFEGGDAAWEETKLKSYARSEIRLVEVQEGLCSEVKTHQDICYSLAEEAEQAIEKWWFHEDPNSVDLHTWLCIETLQYCCPQNHFGELCHLCPLDKNNAVCSGRGRCDGDGTRRGDGSCKCNRAFGGEHCEACAKNFYSVNTGCDPCHRACDGCTGEGAAACDKCKNGWQLESGVCTDVDECTERSTCKDDQYCINKEGSHSCKSCDKSCATCEGPGPSNCTSCENNVELWSGMCVDETIKSDLLSNALRRGALYFGLIVITIFIFRRSRALASVVVYFIAAYIYFNEKISKMSIVNVIQNIYFK